MKGTLYVNDSADSKEGIRLLEEAGIDFRRIPANGSSMPAFLIGSAEYAGLWAIRLYLSLLQSAQEETT